MAPSPKARNFLVTYWQPKPLYWDPEIMRYACKCDDQCDEDHEGRWHGHYYVYFKNPRTWKVLKDYYGNDAHIERVKVNSQAIKYVLGEGEHAEHKTNIEEKGDMPCDNGKHLTYRQALEMTAEEVAELPLMDALAVKKAKKIEEDTPKPIRASEWHKEIEVVFITGPSGVGKSLAVKEDLIKNHDDPLFDEVKREGDFWHGISGQTDIAVYDDFRDSHMKASEFINFIDYHKHKLNVKGGSKVNNYRRIYITSVQRPEKIYSNLGDEPRQQWLRRIKIINLWPPGSEDIDEEGLN